MATNLIPTPETMTEAELADFLNAGLIEPEEDDDPLVSPIPTCAGEWRREPDGLWRFYQDPEW